MNLRQTSILVFSGILTAMGLTFSAQVAFANPDRGGNANGELGIYTDSKISNVADTLRLGGTYYIVLENPGGNTNLKNEKDVPTQLSFNFFSAPHNFHPNPGKWDLRNPAFTVTGAEVGSSPYVFKVIIPGTVKDGNYKIETGPIHMNNDPKTPNHGGEDEMYFVVDPNVGASNTGIPIINPPAGQLPEVPYAGVLPILAVFGGGYFMLRRRRKSMHL